MQQRAILERFASDHDECEGKLDTVSSIPRQLHHYTTLEGLTGIIGSNCLRASDVRFVNDASELIYASELVDSEVAKVITESEVDGDPLLHVQSEMANPFLHGPKPFIACFCEEADLLSQWRGYRANETGYSLGFDLTRLAPSGLPPNTLLRKVIYDPEEQRNAIRSVIRTWLETATSLMSTEVGQEDLFPAALWALQSALTEHHLCFKHPSFSEEREWRLIKLVDVGEEIGQLDDRRREQALADANRRLQALDSSYTLPNMTRQDRVAEGIKICFRRSPLGLVPFVDLPLHDTAGVFTDQLPLWEIVQGPNPSPKLSLESLTMFLRSCGYGMHTQLRPSQIPLRT